MKETVYLADSNDCCPDEGQFSSYVDGNSLPTDTRDFELHVENCSDCRTLLSDYAKTLADYQAALQPGEQAGRYHIESILGTGAMGTVYLAKDSELERSVALKFVRTDFIKKSAKQRLVPSLRDEAQSLAQLSHPNIVSVYEFGVYEGESFVAMEYVEGETLLQWSSKNKSWRENLEVLVQAGQGLVAAHSAKIVHRDIKPGNILIGQDGRVRILDFGLARWQPSILGTTQAESTITSIGGTSAYMAPEQSEMPADFLSDQYSFCVTAHEILLGVRPGDRTPTKKIPSRLLGILRKGLHTDRTERFSGMEELLEALCSQLVPLRRWYVAATIVGLVILLAVVWKTAFSAGEHKDDQIHCSGEESFSAVWDDERASTFLLHWQKENAPPAVIATLVSALGGYRMEWVSQYREACMDSKVRNIQSEEVWDKRILCLDQRKNYAIEVLSAVEALPGNKLDKGVSMIGTIPSPMHCGNLRYLSDTADMPTDPAIRTKIVSLTSQLVSIEVREGAREQDLEVAQNVIRSASEFGYYPLLAQARSLAGIIELNGKGSTPAVRETLHYALADAERGGDARTKYKAAMYLSAFEDSLEKHPEALQWLDYAEASLSRGGLLSGLESARIAFRRGTIAKAKGQMQEARDLGKVALGHLGSGESPLALLVRTNVYSLLGGVARKLGDYADAKEYHQQSLSILQSLYGQQHERTADAHQHLAVLATVQGELAVAKDRFIEVRAIWEQAYSANHVNVGIATMSLGAVYMQLGEFDIADREMHRAERIFGDLGGQDRLRAKTIGNRGALALYRENYSDALAYSTESLSVLEKLLGADHPSLALGLLNVGIAQTWLGKPQAAKIALQRAIALQEKSLGVNNPAIAQTVLSLGRLQLQQRQWKPAVKTMKRVIALDSPHSMIVAETQLGLAKALWHLNRQDKQIAPTLASAKQILSGVEIEHKELLTEIELWQKKTNRP